MCRTLLLMLILAAVLESCRKKGCTDTVSPNYNEEARYEDGSCLYTYGCTDPLAANYDSAANVLDKSCRYEYVADGETFEGWINWLRTDSLYGVDAWFSSIHLSNDTLSIREIFTKEVYPLSNQTLPAGARYVHYGRVFNGNHHSLTAMIKRGNAFDPDNNDWEWFVLNFDGTIAKDSNGTELRGKNLISYGCANCHAGAVNDYVFTR